MSASVDSSVGLDSDWTRSAGPPARSIARRRTSTDSPMQRTARGCGLTTIALRPLTAISALPSAVEVGFVVGTMPATTPTGVAISTSSGVRVMIPTVGSRSIEAQMPSVANRFLSVL